MLAPCSGTFASSMTIGMSQPSSKMAAFHYPCTAQVLESRPGHYGSEEHCIIFDLSDYSSCTRIKYTTLEILSKVRCRTKMPTAHPKAARIAGVYAYIYCLHVLEQQGSKAFSHHAISQCYYVANAVQQLAVLHSETLRTTRQNFFS